MIGFSDGSRGNVHRFYVMEGITSWLDKEVTFEVTKPFGRVGCLVQENKRIRVEGRNKTHRTIGLRNLLFYRAFGSLLGTFHPNCGTKGCINPYHTAEAEYFEKHPGELAKRRAGFRASRVAAE